MTIKYLQQPTDKVDDTGTPYLYAEVTEDGTIQGYKRADGDWDIPLDLPEDVLEVLNSIAKERGITLNDVITEAIVDQIRIVKEQAGE